jgi:mannose-6-phosphate isomerase-like protein (cupin superfamily)
MSKLPAFLLMLAPATGLVFSADESSLPAAYKSASDLMATLAKSAETNPAQATAPISNQSHYRVNIVRRDRPGFALTHATGPAKGSEVHYIIDGAATVVTGGTIVRPAGDARNATIEGGETRHVSKGDVIVVPAGTPHWYKEVEGSVTYLEVRFDVDLGK